MLYISALATGDFPAIETYWPVIQKTFPYFDIHHVWTCMGSGYAEKARTWIEGANFGAFTSFINMARAVGDTKSCEHAVSLASKMLEARFLSAPYDRQVLCYGIRRTPKAFSFTGKSMSILGQNPENSFFRSAARAF